MMRLAMRNLLHDKLRLAVTLIGIVIAIVLITIQIGLLLGFATMTSNLIDNSEADLWVCSRYVQSVDVGIPFSTRALYRVLATPGVASAENLIIRLADWKRPNGGEEKVTVIGFQPEGDMAGPWNVVAGTTQSLKTTGHVFADLSYRDKLALTDLGQAVEIGTRRARVVGFTEGIRAFNTLPYVFTSVKNAREYTRLAEDQTVYILVRALPGTEARLVKEELEARLPDLAVYTTEEFSRKTRFYWTFTTGVGLALFISTLVGLVAGIVVVGQTLYATTMDHLREFGTLKAIGASNWYVCGVIVQQAVAVAAIGYPIGIVLSLMVVEVSRRNGATILVPPAVMAGMFAVALVMCVSASIASINKVLYLDPALAFKQ
jgi:putative ABC transport system permease protein